MTPEEDSLWSAIRERLQELLVEDAEALLGPRVSAFKRTTGDLADELIAVLRTRNAIVTGGGGSRGTESGT